MFSSLAHRLPTNTGMVDRGLNVAYERIRDVHNNLDKLLWLYSNMEPVAESVDSNTEAINTLTEVIKELGNTGVGLSNDLGYVGDENSGSEQDARSLILAFAEVLPYASTLVENITNIQKAGIYIEDVIAVALVKDYIANVSDNITEVKTTSENISTITLLAHHIDEVISIVNNLNALIVLNDDVENIDLVAGNLTTIKKLSSELYKLTSLEESLDNIQSIIDNYDKISTILDNLDVIQAVGNNTDALNLIEQNQEKFQYLIDNQETLLNLFNFIDNYVDDLKLISLRLDDIHKTVDNLELIKEYADLSEKITALYSALYPNAQRSEIDVDNSNIQELIDTVKSGTTLQLTADLRGNLVIPSDKVINLNLQGYTITNTAAKATITISLGGTLNLFGSGTVDNTINSKPAILNNGSCIIKDTVLTKSQGEYYAILNHGRMILGNGTVVTLKAQATSSCVVNGYYDYSNTNHYLGHVANENLAYPKLTINGGEYTGGRNTIKNDDGGLLTINGGVFNNSFTKDSLGAGLFNVNRMTVNNATVNAGSGIAVYNRYYNSTVDLGYVEISNGYFDGKVINHNSYGVIKITGGEFTADVTEFQGE